MVVLQIDVCANIDSTGKIAESIGILAQKNGFTSYIAWGRRHKESQSILIHIGNRLNCLEHVVETRLFDNHGLASRIATKQLIDKIDQIAPDIIHLHCVHGYYLNYSLLFEYLSSKNIQVVWTFHDCWAFTGHCAHFALCGCEKWKTGCYSCPQKKDYPSSYLFDRSRKNYIDKKKSFTATPNLTIVSVAKWLDDFVSQSFLSNFRHIVITNGINTDLFSPSANKSAIRNRLGIKENETMLLGVTGTWSERKGLNDFIKLGNYLQTTCKIVLVGLNKQQIASLPNTILGIERTDSAKELADYYSAADLFLNLTYEDTYPTTNLEAISCGTPCLTYRTGGSPESVTNEIGFVVSQGDINAVLQCVEIIQKKNKNMYSAACRNYALAHFRAEDRFQDYINLYKELLCM